MTGRKILTMHTRVKSGHIDPELPSAFIDKLDQPSCETVHSDAGLFTQKAGDKAHHCSTNPVSQTVGPYLKFRLRNPGCPINDKLKDFGWPMRFWVDLKDKRGLFAGENGGVGKCSYTVRTQPAWIKIG